jgi:hypothetical protein
MNTISIGRAPQNNYVINDRTEVTSRFHADLFVNGDGTYTLTDHSSHGTTVNGQLLHHSSRPVRYGDSIVFANTAQFDWSRVGTGPGPDPGPYSNPMAPHAVASMVLGILSLVSWYGGLILGIIGLCLAANGLKRTRNNRERYRGIKMLKAGLVCSIIAVSIYAIMLIVALSLGIGMASYYL